MSQLDYQISARAVQVYAAIELQHEAIDLETPALTVKMQDCHFADSVMSKVHQCSDMEVVNNADMHSSRF